MSSSQNSAANKSPLTCPVGMRDCPVLTEATELRLEVAKLAEQSRTDTLTGLANYRAFREALGQEIERTQRSDQPTSLIMLDIDHFKQVNDSWGHEVGNRALVHIASLMVQTVRKLDIPCRYGGEEFAVILPDTDLPASLPVAERLREAIAAHPVPVAGQKLALTVSLGLSSYTTKEKKTAEELIEEADKHLYQAKERGRNRTCHPEIKPVDAVSPDERQALADLFGAPTKDRSENESRE